MGDTALHVDGQSNVAESKRSAVLRRANVPLILCDLQDISETGCRCIARIRVNDSPDANKSPAYFRAGELFEAEITYDPFIPFLCLPVKILSAVALSPKLFELALEFVELDSDLNQILIESVAKIDGENKRLAKLAAESKSATEVDSEGEFDGAEPKLGEILCRTNAIGSEQLEKAVLAARQSGVKLGEYLIRAGIVTPFQVLEARSAQTGLAYAQFDVNAIPDELLKLLPLEQLKRFECVPIAIDGESIQIACANPLSKLELEALEQLCGKHVQLALCPDDLPGRFQEAIEKGMVVKRRSHTRFNVAMPATIRCCISESPIQFGSPVSGEVVDISKDGMSVTGPAIFPFGAGALPPERLKLLVTVTTGHKEIVALCEARHIRCTPSDGPGAECVYGLKIDAIINEDSEIMRGISSQSAHGLQS